LTPTGTPSSGGRPARAPEMSNPGSMPRRRRPARVLWVTEEPPDRALGGGNIRQSHLFQVLAAAMPTDLLVTGSVADEDVRALAANLIELHPHPVPESQRPLGRRARELAVLLGSPYPSALYPARRNRRALAHAIRAIEARYDLVCVEHEALAPLVARRRSERWIITFHHVLSAMIAEQLPLAPGKRQRWFRARDLTKAQRLERWTIRSYDRCIVCSEEDATRLAPSGDDDAGGRAAVIPNGVDLAALRPTAVPDAPCVLLPGTLAWWPNVDGAVWLCHEIWPLVRAAVPGATLVLAGRSPDAEVIALGRLAGVSVHADVASMAPYLEAARVVVVPLRVGTGTRIKALEAMAAGRPIVGTRIGMEGIGIRDRVHARVADHADAFANAVIELLEDSAQAHALGRAARAHVERHYGWDRVGDEFVRLVSQLLDREPGGQVAARASSKSA
jgi:glycosyltransferase involved in cell wall biosynthesis